MKKTIAKILVVAMMLSTAVLMFAACGSSDSKYVGTWEGVSAEVSGTTMKLSDMDMTFSIEITDDGKVTATTNGESDGEGTWEEDGDKINITDAQDSKITGTINDKDQLELVFEDEGITFVLEKK